MDMEVPWRSDQHAVDRNLALVEAIGAPAAAGDPRWPGARVSSERDFMRRPRIAVHPDAGAPSKKWPAERFGQLIGRIASWADVVLIGANRMVGDDVLRHAAATRVENRMGETTLPELVRLLEEADALVSNDSGPAHIMTALGKTGVNWLLVERHGAGVGVVAPRRLRHSL